MPGEGASRITRITLNDLAADPGVFIGFVDGTHPVVAIRDHHLAVWFVSPKQERGERLPLANLDPLLFDVGIAYAHHR